MFNGTLLRCGHVVARIWDGGSQKEPQDDRPHLRWLVERLARAPGVCAGARANTWDSVS